MENSNLSATQYSNSNSNSNWSLQIQEAKNRCKIISSQINSIPSFKLTDPCKQTLLRLINSELKYLTQLTFSSSPSILTLNIGYIQSILHILQQPFISNVSRVCKPSNGVYVDIVCILNKDPVWIIVSDKNRKYVSWEGNRKSKGLKFRVEEVLKAAKSCLMLKPKSILLFFGNGIDRSVSEKVRDEFRGVEVEGSFCLDSVFSEEVEDDWVNVIGRCYEKAETFQIMVDDCVENVDCSEVESRVRKFDSGDGGMDLFSDETRVMLGEKFCSLLLSMRVDVKWAVKPEDLIGEDVLNFDTTALIALVSGISNGGTEKLLATPESELRERFKINYEFVIAQVMSELQKSILEELSCVISGKIGMICESVHLEFRELVSMCGGPNEKLRAEQLLKCLLIVPDSPSARMMDILTTRKIALKNKTVFGTGDQWLAPTLTANMGFVRAISQTGMSLMTVEHRPRALTGD